MSRIRLTFTDEHIDNWFNSMHAYKEEIHRRYLDSLSVEKNGNMVVEPSRGVAECHTEVVSSDGMLCSH